jgi:hypothetical protein
MDTNPDADRNVLAFLDDASDFLLPYMTSEWV